MMIRVVLIFLLLLCCAAPSQANQHPLDNRIFAQLPVQRLGRIEPIDSFARSYFRQFFGGFGSSETATGWLAELLFNPEQAYNRKTFNVSHPDARHALNLPDTKDHLFSFQEMTAAMGAHRDMMTSLLEADVKNMTDPGQRQLLDLYQNMLLYFEISRSLSLVLPDFSVDNPTLANSIGVPAGRDFSYLEMAQHKAAYIPLALGALKKLGNKTPDAEQASLLKIGFLLEHMEADKQTRILQIIPPAWTTQNNAWLSPWAIFKAGQGSPRTAALLQAWQEMATAYRTQDQTAWNKACDAIMKQTKTLAGNAVRPNALTAEYVYNLAHLFAFAGGFYFLTLVLMTVKRDHGWTAFSALAVGFIFHTAGLLLRIFILARPPVGTLYESILFVGWVAVAGSLMLEWRGRQGLGLMIGGLSGLSLLLLAPLFAQSGDTMEPLVAVLNTNFWLATHVLAITTGYGCCLVTGLLAHIYLVQKIRRAPPEKIAVLARAILGAALVALCFATVGTILGGIWADQSWGRFWGWDPKENGAMLIVLWLLFILHGRLSGLLDPDHFALGAAATVIVVALSWFGVNLLNVGLHSYGFTSGIALYLGLFVGGELTILGICQILLHRYRAST